MKKAVGIALLGVLAAPAAHANVLYLECKRYESKCAASDCYRIASGLREDTQKQILTLQKMETVEYRVTEKEAVAILANAAPEALPTRDNKYYIPYKDVSISESSILIEKKKEEIIREKIEVDKHSGFYAHYVLHTDKSLDDVPLGEPYTAYFGWCEDVTHEKP